MLAMIRECAVMTVINLAMTAMVTMAYHDDIEAGLEVDNRGCHGGDGDVGAYDGFKNGNDSHDGRLSIRGQTRRRSFHAEGTNT
ncbi:unnamed protein product, partial [Symbiodinium necroappetens]